MLRRADSVRQLSVEVFSTAPRRVEDRPSCEWPPARPADAGGLGCAARCSPFLAVTRLQGSAPRQQHIAGDVSCGVDRLLIDLLQGPRPVRPVTATGTCSPRSCPRSARKPSTG